LIADSRSACPEGRGGDFTLFPFLAVVVVETEQHRIHLGTTFPTQAALPLGEIWTRPLDRGSTGPHAIARGSIFTDS
jgi:hypothetical protein